MAATRDPYRRELYRNAISTRLTALEGRAGRSTPSGPGGRSRASEGPLEAFVLDAGAVGRPGFSEVLS